MKLTASLAIIVALAVAGCGGGGGGGSRSESSTQKIRKAANQFSAAFGSGDIKTACALWGPGEDASAPGTCYRIYSGGLDASAFQTFLTAKVERVAVAGATATVAYSNDWIAKFKKEGSDWVMSELGEAKYYSGLEEEEGEKERDRELREAGFK